MTRSVTAKLSQVKFPPVCVVCMSPAAKKYEIESTINYGRRSYTVKVKVPMCDPHAQAATFKSPAEKFMAGLAVLGGILGGLAAATILFARWQGNVNILAKLLGVGIFGFGVFIIIWWFTTASIVPFFAASHAKESRNAVRIGMYWPREEIVRLDFENEQLAGMMQNIN